MPREITKDGKRFRPVALIWIDAAFHAETPEALYPIPCVTLGFVWERTKEYVKVASEIFADGQARSFCVVPRGAMQPKIVYLDELEVPQSFIDYQLKMLPFLA